MDLGFEQLLAEHQQDFKDAEVYNNWMPPDGEYIASLVKFDAGEKKKDGVKTAWYKLTGCIEVEKTCPQDVQQNDKLAGKEFLINFYRSSAYGILKGDARMLSGNPLLDDLKEAYEVLEASIGLVVRVKIVTSFSDKYKKDFTNCYIQEVINTTTETSAEEIPDTVAPGGYDSVETPVEVPAEAPTE